MAGTKEIQSRIKSVQDTMKITNAMYMISSSKVKRAKEVLEDTAPYFFSIQGAISRILRHVPDIEHRYFDQREDIPKEKRKIGIIAITADKGLAGAYNHNVIKMAEETMSRPGEHKLFVLGVVGRQYFAKKNVDMDGSFLYTVQKPTVHRARVISEKILTAFDSGALDEVHIIYTQMVNAVASETRMEQLLPLKKNYFDVKIPIDLYMEEISLRPSPEIVLNHVVPNYVTGTIYGCLVESYASEHNSRMMAMEASTKSARDMLRLLGIEYNRARQAAITQEITEVISGAKAQKRK